MKKVLKPTYLDTNFICSDHFNAEDILDHGQGRRLRQGALPVNFPRLEAASGDHDYVRIRQLDVRIIFVQKYDVWIPQGLVNKLLAGPKVEMRLSRSLV